MTSPRAETAGDERVAVRGVALAPFAVSREGGLPAAAAAALRCPGVAVALGEAIDREDQGWSVAEPLREALFRAVPSLPDKRLRRAAIDLQRDLHNRRTAGDLDRVEALEPWLDDAGRAFARAWRFGLAEAAELRKRAAEGLTREEPAAGAAAARALATPAMDRALALTSPELAQELRKEGRALGATTKTGRVLARLVGRAALKSSPLTWFTPIALAGFGERPARVSERSVVAAPRALAFELLRACAAHPVVGAHLELERAPGVDGGRSLCTWSGKDGFFWRFERRIDETSCPAELTGGPERAPAEAWRARLTAAGRPEALVGAWVASGLLRPVVPWRRGEPRPLARLADWLADLPEDTAPGLERSVRQVATAESSFAAAGGAERGRIVQGALAAIDDAFRALDWPRASWFASNRLFFEDAPASGPGLDLPAVLADDLAEAARFVAEAASLNPVYPHLVAAFRRGFPAGRCDDVPGFLASFVERLTDLRARLGLHAGVGPVEVLRRADGDPLPCWPGRPLPLALFTQVAARSWEAVAAGDYRLAVNLAVASSGGVVARHRELLGAARVGEAIRAWAGADAGRVLEVGALSEWHDLQAPAAGIFPNLRWPTELAFADDDVSAARLSLVLDEPSGELRFLCDGEPVTLVLLGALPTQLLTGPLSLLATLAQPWLVGAERQDAPVRLGPAVTHRPRVQRGRVVLHRAEWTLSAGDWPRRENFPSDLAWLEGLERWRRRIGLPFEVFVNTGSRASFDARERKPLWARFDSPHALAALDHQLEGATDEIRVVEALPAHDEHPDARGEARALEIVSLASVSLGRAHV